MEIIVIAAGVIYAAAITFLFWAVWDLQRQILRNTRQIRDTLEIIDHLTANTTVLAKSVDKLADAL